MDGNRAYCSAQERQEARNLMNYWKKKRCVDEMYASELGFSLIYRNIKQEYQKQALATMGLTRLPNVILLIQVDDYLNKYSELEVTREFSVKAAVWNCLQSFITASDYPGFAANLIGLDTLICFLCMPENKTSDQLYSKLQDFSVAVSQAIYRDTTVAVTVCISDFCRKLSDFPVAYMKARERLYNSFYTSKTAAIISYQAEGTQTHKARHSGILDYYPAICAAISSGDKNRFYRILIEVVNLMHQEQVTPKQFKAAFAGLIHTLEVYCLKCGIDNKNEVSSVTAKSADMMLRCSYAEDNIQYLMEYYSYLTGKLEKISSRDHVQAFREPIIEYISNHYGDLITLKQISEMMGYSIFYTTRLFKKCFGCTLTKYLSDYRIEQGKLLLNATSYSVREIAAKCGFESANYFSSCFRRNVGMSPVQYRRKEMPPNTRS